MEKTNNNQSKKNNKRTSLLFRSCVFGVCFASTLVSAEAFAVSYHVVGWFNTVVPGGGQYLLGHPLLGATQTALEGGTFGAGYAMSRLAPMTLDGVPEDLQVETGSTIFGRSRKQVCTIVNGKKTCETKTVTSSSVDLDTHKVDNTKAGTADLLQEFGIKYHLVNVYNAYREAAGSTEIGQGIDSSSTKDLFLSPFRKKNLTNPWVFIPLTLLAGFTYRDYVMTARGGGITPLQPMTGFSNQLLAFNYQIAQPFGSGAPEEMFYRGFLQNEMYELVPSPFFSITMSTLAFAFSHSAPGRPTAAVAGAYLGYLAHRNHGELGPGITVHFWTVVFLGIETIAITSRAQGYMPLRYVTFDIIF